MMRNLKEELDNWCTRTFLKGIQKIHERRELKVKYNDQTPEFGNLKLLCWFYEQIDQAGTCYINRK